MYCHRVDLNMPTECNFICKEEGAYDCHFVIGIDSSWAALAAIGASRNKPHTPSPQYSKLLMSSPVYFFALISVAAPLVVVLHTCLILAATAILKTWRFPQCTCVRQSERPANRHVAPYSQHHNSGVTLHRHRSAVPRPHGRHSPNPTQETIPFAKCPNTLGRCGNERLGGKSKCWRQDLEKKGKMSGKGVSKGGNTSIVPAFSSFDVLNDKQYRKTWHAACLTLVTKWIFGGAMG